MIEIQLIMHFLVKKKTTIKVMVKLASLSWSATWWVLNHHFFSFLFSKKVTHHPDFSPKKETTERTYSTNSSNESDIRQDNLPNIFNVSCAPSSMPSALCLVNTNTGQSSEPQMDPFDYDTLTKQYHSASNLLQNISKTAYFPSSSGKYTENYINTNTTTNYSSSPSGAKYYENKYFPGSQSDFSTLIPRSVSSTNYPFGPSNMLPPGFGPPPPQSSIISKPFPQISVSGYLPTTSSYPSYATSSFNGSCFNPKYGATENNNYQYPPNLFSSKIPSYSSSSQGSTQIFPPPFGGFFPPGISSSIIGSNIQENTSSYNSGMVGNNSGGSQQTPTTGILWLQLKISVIYINKYLKIKKS